MLDRTEKSVRRQAQFRGIAGRRAAGNAKGSDFMRPEKRAEQSARASSRKGPDHPAWQGGGDLNRYGAEFWTRNAPATLLKDNWTCKYPDCGYQDDSGSTIQVHHIVRFRVCSDNDMRNLITVCRHHHYNMKSSHHWTQEQWDAYPRRMIGTLPEFQRVRLDGYVPHHADHKPKPAPRRKTVEQREAELMAAYEGDETVIRCRRDHPKVPGNITLNGRNRAGQDCTICVLKRQKINRDRRNGRTELATWSPTA
jgi:hypothetical protein